MKKIKFKILSIVFLILFFLPVSALATTAVLVVPETKITTSNPNLKEGDSIYFIVVKAVFLKNKLLIKEGSITEGIVTYLEPNSWSGAEAKITLGQFVVRDASNKRLKLVGNVYKAGNCHEDCSALFHLWPIRGGEVQIKPEKDSFTLFLKEDL